MRQLNIRSRMLVLLLFFISNVGIIRAINSVCVTNASGLQTCAAKIFKPTTLQELQQAVLKAITDNKKVRAIGGLHSDISDVIVGDTNYFIDTSGLNRILEINVQKSTIKVQAGVNLRQLSLELAKVGLQLIDQPGPYDATAAGMIANGAHESGKHGCVSDSVLALELVDGKGIVREISPTSHAEWLSAARVSLGVLGVIYSVTFQCYPATIRHVLAEVQTADQSFLNNIPQYLNESDNFQFLINPYSRKVLKQTFNLAPQPADNNTLQNFGHYLSQSQICGDLSVILNPEIPVDAYLFIDDAIIAGGAVDVREFFYKGYSFFHANTSSRARLVEIAFDQNQIVPALEELFNLVQEYHTNSSDFILLSEVRYAKDSKFTLLSPTRSDKPSWMIGLILIYPWDTKAATSLLNDLTVRLQAAPFNGRPSWGNNPEFLTYADTKRMYGQPNVHAFNTVRRILDPNGIFYTPYFEQRLGPL